MADKKIEPVDVNVDAIGLSLLGWKVDQIEARLVTESYGRREYVQKVVVSGTVRFEADTWSDRFDDGGYAPTLLLALRSRGGEVAAGHSSVVMETIKKASRRPLRISETSMSWEVTTPQPPETLVVELTAYDWEETGYTFGAPSPRATALPTELVDETERRSVRLWVTCLESHVLHDQYDARVRVHVEGIADIGSAEELLADHLRDDDEDYRADVRLVDECPFEVAAPSLEIEVLDDTGFVLGRHEVHLGGGVPVGEGAVLPVRRPRWIVQTGDSLGEYAGTPTRVVVRIVDPD